MVGEAIKGLHQVFVIVCNIQLADLREHLLLMGQEELIQSSTRESLCLLLLDLQVSCNVIVSWAYHSGHASSLRAIGLGAPDVARLVVLVPEAFGDHAQAQLRLGFQFPVLLILAL